MKRILLTGDTGYIEDGMLFFSGRNDDLVKLHGYRIELNEITTALNQLPFNLNIHFINTCTKLRSVPNHFHKRLTMVLGLSWPGNGTI